MYIAEKGLEALELLADMGGWDSVEEMAEEVNKTVDELLDIYFEMEEDDDALASQLGGKSVTVDVYIIHKEELILVYRGPGVVAPSNGRVYFDYEDNELDA